MKWSAIKRNVSFVCPGVLFLFLASSIRADHGPGTTGGSFSLSSGNPIPLHHLEFGFRWIYTNYENISGNQLETLTQNNAVSHIDTLGASQLGNFYVAYGVLPGLEVSANIGYYAADNIHVSLKDMNNDFYLIDAGNILGLTDAWFNVKYKVVSFENWYISVISGFKVPTGLNPASLNPIPLPQSDEVNFQQPSNTSSHTGTVITAPHLVEETNGSGSDTGQPAGSYQLEPAVTPGSGSFALNIGLAYLYEINPKMILNTNTSFIYHFVNDSYRIGEIVQGGASFSYLFFDLKNKFHISFYAVAEVFMVWQGQVAEDGLRSLNSGGFNLYLNPGIGVLLFSTTKLTFLPQFPVLRFINEPQQRVSYKLSVALSISLHI